MKPVCALCKQEKDWLYECSACEDCVGPQGKVTRVTKFPLSILFNPNAPDLIRALNGEPWELVPKGQA